LTKLKRLDIQSNRLTKIENLESQCENLEELYLAHNGIDDDGASQPTGLAMTFPKLNVLDLSRNRLASTAPFAHLSALEELWLSGNKMQDFEAVAPLRDAAAQERLPSLETLYLEYNPMASDFEYRKKLAEWIPTLKQIDATMIGGTAAHYGTIGMTGTIGGGGGATMATEERLRELQAAAIERAKQESEAKGE
jgi:protein phosphatase 1 regulatory subunit 7